MRPLIPILLLAALSLSGCASVTVWETSDIPYEYEVLGPVAVTEEFAEKRDKHLELPATVPFFSKDGIVSDQLNPKTQKALAEKRNRYKQIMIGKLIKKARRFGADGVILNEFNYVPSYFSPRPQALATAKGTMILLNKAKARKM